MKRFILSGFMIALFGFMMSGCGGGGSTPPGSGSVDPNAPAAKLDPTTLKIPFN